MHQQSKAATFFTHAILIFWSFIVLFPLWTMLVNSLKPKREIFRHPYNLPNPITFEGYQSAWVDGRFDLYFKNSLIVTLVSLGVMLFFASMAAYALANWRSRLSDFIYLFFVAGLMIPIRLGTINIFQIILKLGLNDSIWGLVPVYIAMSLPTSTFILTPFIRTIPRDLFEAARVDGASEWRIYSSIILPIIRPAMATAFLANLIPVWNDLWFPLIFIREQSARTVPYGVSLLFGQYQTDWNRILSTLSLAAIPVLIMYLLMARQFIKGLTAGAVKG